MERLKQSYSRIISISILISSFIIFNSVYSFAQSGTKWATNGNNVNQGDFIGTLNGASLDFKVNNALALYIKSDGNLFITKLTNNGKGFVMYDGNGMLSPFQFPNDPYKILLGDGSWGNIPIPHNYWQLHDPDIFTMTPGNVGIGTDHPMFKLDVDGDVRITENLYVGGGIIITDKVNATSEVNTEKIFATQELKSASLKADSILMDSTKAFYGESNFKGDVKLKYKLDVTGDVQVNGNFRTAGSLTFAGNKTISYIPSQNGNDGIFSFATQIPATTPCNPHALTGNETWFGGRINIWGNGSWNPNTLPVSILTMGSDGANGIIDVKGSNSQGLSNLLINWYCGRDVVVGGGGWYDQQLPNSGTFTTFYDTYLARENGKVAIGKNTANAKLDIEGDVRISSLIPASGTNLVQVGTNGILTSTSSSSLGLGLWQQSTNGNDISNTNTGNIGIGTNTPSAKLDIQGGWVKIGDASNAIQFETQSGFHRIAFNELRFWDWDSNNGSDMVTFKNGNVGIGTTSPSSRLQVKVDAQSSEAFSIYEGASMNFLVKSDGKVWAREVTVLLTAPLGDFVFDKDYHLITLKELEDYVIKNRHLPGIPSASDVSKGGINVGEFQNLLLQKIEEMSLYIIQLEKRINELEK